MAKLYSSLMKGLSFRLQAPNHSITLDDAKTNVGTQISKQKESERTVERLLPFELFNHRI